MPQILSMIHIKRITPVPAVIFLVRMTSVVVGVIVLVDGDDGDVDDDNIVMMTMIITSEDGQQSAFILDGVMIYSFALVKASVHNFI